MGLNQMEFGSWRATAPEGDRSHLAVSVQDSSQKSVALSSSRMG